MNNRPRVTRKEVEEILNAYNVADTVALVGIRGYYLDSMGKRGENDRNIYDDAIILITPAASFAFRANTDPSVFRH